jgi:hypothetical protein
MYTTVIPRKGFIVDTNMIETTSSKKAVEANGKSNRRNIIPSCEVTEATFCIEWSETSYTGSLGEGGAVAMLDKHAVFVGWVWRSCMTQI